LAQSCYGAVKITLSLNIIAFFKYFRNTKHSQLNSAEPQMILDIDNTRKHY